MNQCEKYIDYGLIIRYLITIGIFYYIKSNDNNSLIHYYLYIILVIILIAIDQLDNIFLTYYKIKKCTKTFNYQINDKICDAVSYLLLLFILKNDNLLLYFVLFRIIGVIMFYFTKSSVWLIIFFDFVKEYLLYLFIFGKKFIYLPFFIVCKIIFEYYYHTIINKSQY